MKLLIAVPSKGRPEEFKKLTFGYLPSLGYDYRVFVEPQDAAAYSAYVPHLQVLPESNLGLGYALTQIQAYAQENEYGTIFKLDDDIEYWSPGIGSTTECKKTTPQTLKQAISSILRKMKEYPLLGAVSFDYRTFMHINSNVWAINRRLQSAYLTRTETLYPNIKANIFEDFHCTLQNWMHGFYTGRYLHAGQHMGSGKLGVGITRGGHQDAQRTKKSKEAIFYLKEIFPALRVRKVDHPWGYEPDLNHAKRFIWGEGETTL